MDRRPLLDVARVDRRGAQPEPAGHRDLVAHQRQQRADDQGGPVALVAAHAGRDPVDEALAPAGALDDERAAAVLGDRLDRLALAVAERRVRAEHGLEVLGQVVHRRGQCGRAGRRMTPDTNGLGQGARHDDHRRTSHGTDAGQRRPRVRLVPRRAVRAPPGSTRASPTSRSATRRSCRCPGSSRRCSATPCRRTRTGSPTSSASRSRARSSPTSLRRRTGIAFRPEDIALTAGAFGALGVTIRALCDVDDEVIFLSPPWFFYELMIVSSGATAGPRPAPGTGLRPRPRRDRRGHHAAHPGDHRQQPQQPDRPDLPRTGAGRARPGPGRDASERHGRPIVLHLGRGLQPDRLRRHRVPQPGARLRRRR